MTIATPTHPAIIDSRSGAKVAGSDKPFILALTIGENLFEGIMRVANDAHLQAASINGLGALDDVTVAYYNLETKQYQTQLFKGMYELISMNGNIALFEGKPFIHIHAALGTEAYDVVGGHIMDATVGPSAEITIIPLGGKMGRAFDDRTGLKLLCPIR